MRVDIFQEESYDTWMTDQLKDLYNGNVAWLNDNTIFATVHGSRCYGTNTETSDIDIKGVCVPPKKYYHGFFNNFEQVVQKEPVDLVIYELRKFFNLAANCNPNIIEVLFTDESDHVQVSEAGRILLDNRDKFISKKARHTFSGYAIAQLKRIKGHYHWIMNPPTAMPTRKEMGLPEKTLISSNQLDASMAGIRKKLDSWNLDFLDGVEPAARIAIINNVTDYLTEISVSMDDNLWIGAARTLGYDDNFIQILDKERQYNSKKQNWDQYQHWKATRNPARAAIEEKYGYDCKHAYHLVRLMRMAKEILVDGKVIVKRPDREELLAIRNGLWTYDELIEWAEKQDKELHTIYEQSNAVPHSPNMKELDDLCQHLIEKNLSNS